MTLPAVIRIFFAIDLPLTVKEKLGDYITTLKRKSKSNAIRWSKPENLHVTLQFLAKVNSEHVEMLVANVKAEVEGMIEHAMLSVGSLRLFPNPYRPRVIVLDITPQAELAHLSQLIGKGISASHYPVETRPFHAHLTLGRIKYAQSVNLGFLTGCEQPQVEAVEIGEVVLFRSEPQPEGSQYTVVKTIKL